MTEEYGMLRSIAYLLVVVLELVLRVCATYLPVGCFVGLLALDPLHEALAPAELDPAMDLRAVYAVESP